MDSQTTVAVGGVGARFARKGARVPPPNLWIGSAGVPWLDTLRAWHGSILLLSQQASLGVLPAGDKAATRLVKGARNGSFLKGATRWYRLAQRVAPFRKPWHRSIQQKTSQTNKNPVHPPKKCLLFGSAHKARRSRA